mmetsp:Transcript_31/g.52  ORF Transcript_31/g.52 Transcript_31/m.52 type:complete len:429 (-) Transcript_31:171-1457(-)
MTKKTDPALAWPDERGTDARSSRFPRTDAEAWRAAVTQTVALSQSPAALMETVEDRHFFRRETVKLLASADFITRTTARVERQRRNEARSTSDHDVVLRGHDSDSELSGDEDIQVQPQGPAKPRLRFSGTNYRDTSSSSTPGPRAVTYTPSPGCVGGLRCVRKAQDPNCVRLLYAMCLLAQHRENEAHNIVTLLDCATGAGEDVEDKLRRAEELALVPGDIFTAVLARPKPPRAGPRGENFFEKSIEEMGDLLMGSASSGSDLSDGEEESINMGKGTGCATKNAANANYVAVRKRPAWRDAADYVHALIHRHEGPAISEHNMTGFQNSNALLKNLPTDHAVFVGLRRNFHATGGGAGGGGRHSRSGTGRGGAGGGILDERSLFGSMLNTRIAQAVETRNLADLETCEKLHTDEWILLYSHIQMLAHRC